jgi:WD40 repeat protein
LPRVPYRGIQPFRYADHDLFFARREETAHLLQLVTVYRGVLLYGDSGVGKSSLINAGLLPAALRLGFHPERVRVQPRAGEELVVERSAAGDDAVSLLPSLLAPADGSSPVHVFSCEEFEERVRAAAGSRPLLVFDQFEELVTLFEEAGEQQVQGRIIDLLGVLLREELPVKLLFVFREDYLARVKPLLVAAPELIDQALRIRPPAAKELPTIIRGPFEEHPGHFERELRPALAAELCSTLADRFGSGDVSLSEVQTVCLRLWRSDEPEALLRAKGVQGLLEDHLGEELDRFPEALRYAGAALLSQMVTSSGTRNVISAEDLIGRVQEDERIPRERLELALDRLEGESKLVRRERRRDLNLYEITSEFLVPWITRRRQELIQRQESRRLRRRLLLIGSIVGSIALVALAVASWALWERNKAQRAEMLADALALSEASRAQDEHDLDLKLLLGFEAYRRASGEQADARGRRIAAEARSSMIEALAAARDFERIAIVRGHDGPVAAVASTAGGRTLASAGRDGTVRLWDVRTRRPIGRPLRGHAGAVAGVAVTRNGRTLASAGRDGTVRLWDVRTRRPLDVLTGHVAAVSDVAFSPDGSTLASASEDGTVRLWDVRTRVLLGEPLDDHEAPVSDVAFSPDGTLASAGEDESVRLWNVRARPPRPLGDPLAHEGAVLSVAFSSDGSLLASAGDDEMVRLWDASTLEELDAVTGRDGFVFSVAFSPDDGAIASAGEDGTVRLWEVRARTLRPLGQPLLGHDGAVSSVAFSPDGGTLASAGDDATVRLWDIRTPRSVGPRTAVAAEAASLAFSPDGSTLASGGDDGTRLWDVPGLRLRAELLDAEEFVYGVAFSPNGATLASAGDDEMVRLWDVRARPPGPLGQPLDGHSGDVSSVAFDRDGRMLASAGEDGTVRLWDVRARPPGPLGPPLDGHSGDVSSVAFDPNGSLLASAGEDGTVRLWDAPSGGPAGQPRGHAGEASSVAFSPDGSLLASAGDDGTVRLWDVERRRAAGQLRGRTDAVSSLAFSPDGTTLASSDDTTVRLWDVGTRRPLAELHAHAEAVVSIAFSADGRTLASASDDGMVQLWERILWRDLSELQERVCSLVGAGLRSETWNEVAVGIPYNDTCS